MVAASSANAASGTPSGGGSAAPSVSSAPPARNDGRSSSDESEEEEVEWQPPGSKEVGKTTGPQVISVDRANALQTLGVLPSGQGSSSGMPVVVEIPPDEPSDLTVRVVGVPATESHNDGRTFLQDGFGGLEALVQMESLGATELAVLYDVFDDNDIIGDFILTPREAPLTATELSCQLKNFAVKRELASILSQFDSKQLALRTFGTVSLLRKVAAKYDRIKRKPAEDDGATSVIELQDEALRLRRDQQFQSSYWIEMVAEVQRERNPAVAQMRSDFVLLMEERERDISSLRNQVQTLRGELETARASRKAPAFRSQGPRLRTAHVMNFLQEHATVMMNWPQLRDLLDHLESGTQVPPEWQTVITIMANDNLAFQAPPFFRSKSSQLGKRASGSQSPKSNKKQAPDDVQGLPSEWVGSTSPCRPEVVPLPLSPAQARASLVDYPVVWKDLRRDVKLLIEDRLEYPAALALAGEDKCLHSSFPLDDLTIMLLSMVHWHRLDSAPWTKYVPRRYFTVASVALEGLRLNGDPHSDKAEKDEDYNPHQDQDDGVDDEDEIPDEASDDGVLNVAQRTTKRRRLSQSSAGVSTSKKVKTKSPVKTKVKVGSSGKSKSGSGSSKKPKPKSGGSRHRNSSTATVLAIKGPQHLDAEECRVIESPTRSVLESTALFGAKPC
ncbi:unnamed protein product [Phytophthora fragariaefolia]|uniref:Unnamed protein product n=1 Tax=Phytophthora fragariaefolia TaxID=1490495 RepID=A0A9W7CWX4_9STRA|nr:unnamed protein product [Phytophthora fragariaefolia]